MPLAADKPKVDPMIKSKPATSRSRPNSPTPSEAPSAANPAERKAKNILKTAPEPPDRPAPTNTRQSPAGKLGIMVGLLSRPQGASVVELSQATGWQPHSVRGAMSGALKKARDYSIASEKSEGDRVYRIITPEVAA